MIGPLQIREKMNKSPLCEDTQYCHYHHQVLIGHVQNTGDIKEYEEEVGSQTAERNQGSPKKSLSETGHQMSGGTFGNQGLPHH